MSCDSHVDPQGPSENTPCSISHASGQQTAAWASSHSAASPKGMTMYEMKLEADKVAEVMGLYGTMFGFGGSGHLEEEQDELVEVVGSDGRPYMGRKKDLEQVKTLTVAELEEEKRVLIARLHSMIEEQTAVRKGLNIFINRHIVPSMRY